jgi:hypothetical protein
MFNVGLQSKWSKKKLLKLSGAVIDDRSCSETSVTANLPQLNDPTMITLGTMVMDMLIQQYSQ